MSVLQPSSNIVSSVRHRTPVPTFLLRWRHMVGAIAAAWALASCGGDAVAPEQPPETPIVTVTIAGARNYSFATLGRTVILSATAAVSTGGTAAVTWVSSNSDVAATDPAGVVTATGNGVALIIAQAGAGRDTIQLRVEQIAARLAVPSDPFPVLAGIPLTAPVAVYVVDSGGAVARNSSQVIQL